jgi:Cu/Ag efflux protein CusF
MDSGARSLIGSGSRVTLGLALCLWATWAAGAGQTFQGQGRVTAVDPGRNTLTIAHDAISGLLPASQSEFPVQGSDAISDIRPGDRVRFTLGAADNAHGLLTIVSLDPERSAGARWHDGLLLAGTLLAFLSLAAVVTVGILLWRELRSLQARVLALDHDTGLLRGLVTDTQDGIGQIARALDEAATTFRVGYVQELRRRLTPGPGRGATDTITVGSVGDTSGAVLVVQRGRGDLYRAVERGVAGPGLAVIWDRRRNERRRGARRPVGHERRRLERRGSPSETWTRLGFQLVPVSAVDGLPAPRVLRSAGGERGTPR